jgi:hypothetical protein
MAHVELVEAGKEEVAPEVEPDLGVGGGEHRLNVVIPGVGGSAGRSARDPPGSAQPVTAPSEALETLAAYLAITPDL